MPPDGYGPGRGTSWENRCVVGEVCTGDGACDSSSPAVLSCTCVRLGAPATRVALRDACGNLAPLLLGCPDCTGDVDRGATTCQRLPLPRAAIAAAGVSSTEGTSNNLPATTACICTGTGGRPATLRLERARREGGGDAILLGRGEGQGIRTWPATPAACAVGWQKSGRLARAGFGLTKTGASGVPVSTSRKIL
jgi:hypothetical protein